MRLIAAICGFEEEQMLASTLTSLQNILDLDAVHFQDGAWIKGGYSPISQDMTQSIFQEHPLNCEKIWTDQFSHPPTFPLVDGFYRSQGEKRNHQLDIIEKMMELRPDWHTEEYYILVIDGDEELTGPKSQPFKLKPTLRKIFPFCGIINAAGYKQDRTMGTLRLFPARKGIHYHTEKTMRIHDIKCNVIMDYEHGIKGPNLVFLPGLKLENKWQIRHDKRMAIKMDYVQYRQSQPLLPCRFPSQ